MEWTDAGVARKHIDVAEGLDCAVHELHAGFPLRDVAFDCDYAASQGFDLADDFLDRRALSVGFVVVAPVVDCDVRAFFGARQRDRAAYAAGAAGDDDHFVL